MAVESLECCLSKAMGSSCTGENKHLLQQGAWLSSVASRMDSAGMPGVLQLQCAQSKPAFPSPLAEGTPQGSALQPLRLSERLLTPPKDTASSVPRPPSAASTVPGRSGRSPAASSWLLSAFRSRRRRPGCSLPWLRSGGAAWAWSAGTQAERLLRDVLLWALGLRAGHWGGHSPSPSRSSSCGGRT